MRRQTVQEKMIRYSSHVDFLKECLKETLIPKGFQIKWKLTTDFFPDINSKCEKIKKDASLNLMEQTLKACEMKLQDLKSLDRSENNVVMNDRSLDNMKRNLQKKKMDKIRVLRKSKQSNMDVSEMKVVKVKGDGNCFYRCISKWKYGTEDKHYDIRNIVVNHMATYQTYIDGNIEKHLLEQTQTDGRTSSWATEAEIYAAATVLGTNINIYEGEQVLYIEPLLNQRGTSVVHVQYHGHHFNLLDLVTTDRNAYETPIESFDWFDMVEKTNENEQTKTRKKTDEPTEDFDVNKRLKLKPINNKQI
ncbi:hypothetical protein FSP39_012420 [Pinctada imbricata]|uniref:OTU domain-containing protein n=1 Tax=Pinctada imbricata TaxID=66713 RepID=A0AA88XRK3_PINIB|nr:hypothetical protein FSP39_012420 [Pinctada imbricata]